MEFVYLDQVDANGNYIINPSVPDKDDLKNIQAWRVAVMQGDDGKTYQVRGYSGWYFQASSSTSNVEVNSTPNGEDNYFEGRNKWYNFTKWWANKPKDDPWYADPEFSPGLKFYGLEHLFLGLAEFGGHNFTGKGVNPENPSLGSISRYPGPIRMSHLYGPHAQYQTNTIYHTLKFEYSGKCSARLTGKAPTVENWGNLGSILDGNGKTKFAPGSDTLLIIDGQRGIRIRVNGWHAHFGDHIQANSASNNAAAATASLLAWQLPSSLYSVNLETGAINPVGGFTIRAFHHWWIWKWCEKNPKKNLDRYNIYARAQLFNYTPVAAGGQPVTEYSDPYKVIKDPSHLLIPDDICFTKARIDKTIHEAARPPWIPEPTYAESVAIDFSFKYNSSKWRFVVIDLFSDGTHIGSCTLKVTQEGERVYVLPQPRWKQFTGGYEGEDAEERGLPGLDENQAFMICLPFGQREKSILPTCGVVITKKGFVGKPYTFVPWSRDNPYVKGMPMGGPAIEGVTVEWGDGLADACLLGTPIDHQYDTAGVYTVTVKVRYVASDGRQPDMSKTYITVEVAP